MCRNLSGGVLHRLHHLRMRVAGAAHRDAGGEVEEAVAVDVPDFGAAAVRHHERIVARIRGRDHLGVARDHARAPSGREVRSGCALRRHVEAGHQDRFRYDVAAAARHSGKRHGLRVRLARARVQRAQGVEFGRGGRRQSCPPFGQRQRPADGGARLVDGRVGEQRGQVAVRRCRGCGVSMPKSVITARGPPPRAPLRARAPWPSRKPALVRKSSAVDEAARRRLQHHEGLPRVRGDLRRAAGAGQARVRRVVGADHGAVEVAEAVDLRGAEEADVDAPGLAGSS